MTFGLFNCAPAYRTPASHLRILCAYPSEAVPRDHDHDRDHDRDRRSATMPRPSSDKPSGARNSARDNAQGSDQSKLNATPFARVLTAYMWSKQPPWSATKTAAVLGLGRARVANWIYQGVEPELSTMISVLAKLGIPIRSLLDEYEKAGLPVPPLDIASGTQPPATQQPQPALSPEEQERREWQTMFAHTRRVMQEAGMPSSAINAMLAELEERRLGKPTEAPRRAHEEMQGAQEDQRPVEESDDDEVTRRKRHQQTTK